MSANFPIPSPTTIFPRSRLASRFFFAYRNARIYSQQQGFSDSQPNPYSEPRRRTRRYNFNNVSTFEFIIQRNNLLIHTPAMQLFPTSCVLISKINRLDTSESFFKSPFGVNTYTSSSKRSILRLSTNSCGSSEVLPAIPKFALTKPYVR